MYDEKFLKKAVALSERNAKHGGGPFGAVIVKDGEVVATGCNRVTHRCDPTAHAEIMAIRNAARKLKNFNLEGCEIYSSCEPCPMCFSAIYWAHIDTVYYANTRYDAAAIGFDDSYIYDEIPLPAEKRRVPMVHCEVEGAKKVFENWDKDDTKIKY
ncbi:MAG: nucleoside deaminase [Paludibacteraceae bacterium]|nr:nucleoside deaminase [Paludibacteraceae bacterium]